MGRNPQSESEAHRRPWLLVGIVLAVFAGLLTVIVTEYSSRVKRDTAEDQVYAWSNRLNAAEKDPSGRWKRWTEPTVPETDPWGNPIRVRYEENTLGEKVVVSSDGPDRKQWTRDDISWSSNNISWIAMAKEGAGAVEEVAGAASRGVVGGAIEGVTDHLPKKVRDSLGIPSERDKPAEKPPTK